jgi:hypothetical protein
VKKDILEEVHKNSPASRRGILVKNITLAFSLLFFSSPTFALFCPKNFNQINIGDPLDTIKAICPPDEMKTYDATQMVPQEWDYFAKLAQAIQVYPPLQGTVKMTISFVENKVVNLAVNGIGVSATSVCQKPIKLADSMEEIKAACGSPASITIATPPGGLNPPAKVTELIYNTSPRESLVFINGVLTERRQQTR